MTLRQMIQAAGERPLLLVVLFVLPPVASWIVGRAHGRGGGGRSPWRYVYSVLVYLACVPGIFAAVLTAYTLFFTRENLLDVNVLVYILPVVSMVVTLVLIRGSVGFDEVPGFDRLSGLMVMIGVSLGAALAIEKTRIWIWFGGSLGALLAIAGFVFLVLKWGAHMLFHGSGEPRHAPPTFPDVG